MLTLEIFKRYLNIQDETQDVLLQECIDSAAAYCDSYTNRKLQEAEHIEIKISNSGTIVFLNYYPVKEIKKIEKFIDISGDWTLQDVTIAEIISEDSVLIKSTGLFKIKYAGGYDTDMPADLELAMKKIAAEYYYDSAAGDSRQGISTRNWNSQGSEGKSFKSIIPEADLILDRYRRILI